MSLQETFDLICSRTQGKMTGEGTEFKGLCPAHDDHNPSLSVTLVPGDKILLKCWTGCSFAAILGALNMEKRHLLEDSGPERKESSTKPRKKSTGSAEQEDTSESAREFWSSAENNTERAQERIKQYLTEQRQIPESAYKDLLTSGWLRWCDKKRSLVYAILQPDARDQVRKIQRILLNEQFSKTDKPKMLGHEGQLSVLPPLEASEPDRRPIFLVIEGLESALSVRSEYPQHTILLASGKNDLKHVPNFLPEETAAVLILSDHDGHENPSNNGETAAAALRDELRKRKIEVRAVMPQQVKFDANDALRAGQLNAWKDSLVEVPEPPQPTTWLQWSDRDQAWILRQSEAARSFRTSHPDLDLTHGNSATQALSAYLSQPEGKEPYSPTSADIRAVLTMARAQAGLSESRHSIEVSDLMISSTPKVWWSELRDGQEIVCSPFGDVATRYLWAVSQVLDIDLDTVLTEFLFHFAVAIGGGRELEVETDWTERAILWCCMILPAAGGKSIASKRSGGDILATIQGQWDDEYRDELEEYNNFEGEASERPPKPRRRRLYEMTMTRETLFRLLEENDGNLAQLSDEFRSFTDSFNQYKGRGNDESVYNSLWNGSRVSNPTATEDRAVSRPTFCLSGGVQDAKLADVLSKGFVDSGGASRVLFFRARLNGQPATPEQRDEHLRQIRLEDKNLLQRKFEDAVQQRGQRMTFRLSEIEEQDEHGQTVSARSLLRNLAHEFDLKSRSAPEGVDNAYRRLRSYIFRIALVLHVWDRQQLGEAESMAPAVQCSTARKTIRFMRFFEAQMLSVYGVASASRETQQARRVVEWIASRGNSVKRDQITSALRRNFQNSRAGVTHMIDQLIKSNVLEVHTVRKEGANRDELFLRVTPSHLDQSN